MRAPLAVGICAASIAISGCYSLDRYKGDGQIYKVSQGLTRYEIVLPSIDLREAASHTFYFTGPPREHFGVMLRMPKDEKAAGILSDHAWVHAKLADDRGRVYDERSGRIGVV